MGHPRHCTGRYATILSLLYGPGVLTVLPVIGFVTLLHGLTPRLGVWVMNVSVSSNTGERLLRGLVCRA